MRSKALDVFVSVASVLLLLAAAVAMIACQGETPTSPITIINQNQNTNNNGNTPASPAPGSGLPSGSTVRIEIFGASCPNGANPRPNPGELKLGCSLAVTATPRGPDGAPLPAAVHGPNIAWSVAVGGSALRLVEDGSQPFNASVFATATGSGAITATVQGVTGTLALTVVP